MEWPNNSNYDAGAARARISLGATAPRGAVAPLAWHAQKLQPAADRYGRGGAIWQLAEIASTAALTPAIRKV